MWPVQSKPLFTTFHFLLQTVWRFKKYNTTGAAFKNRIAESLGEHTLNNDNSKKVRQEIVHFVDKTKKEI